MHPAWLLIDCKTVIPMAFETTIGVRYISSWKTWVFMRAVSAKAPIQFGLNAKYFNQTLISTKGRRDHGEPLLFQSVSSRIIILPFSPDILYSVLR
jgi:hypothetical protein